ncbi:MAG: helix-turn-helix domain-containing protein [Streptosporangiaceae bacterium]
MTQILLTSGQVARLLGRSPRTIARMAERGDLEYVQKLPGANGGYLFDAEKVQKLALDMVMNSGNSPEPLFAEQDLQ